MNFQPYDRRPRTTAFPVTGGGGFFAKLLAAIRRLGSPPPMCGAGQNAVWSNGQWRCVPIVGAVDPQRIAPGVRATAMPTMNNTMPMPRQYHHPSSVVR